MDDWLSLVELYEYKVADLAAGREPRGGVRSILQLRETLLGAPLESATLKRFRSTDRILRSIRRGVTPASAAAMDLDLTQVPSATPPRDMDLESIAPPPPPQDEEALILRQLAEAAWRAGLEDEVHTLASRYRRESGYVTLRALHALSSNLEAHAADPQGATDLNLSRFTLHMPVPSENDPLVSPHDPEVARAIVNTLLEQVLEFDALFPRLALPPRERLAYLRRAAMLIADRPFQGRPRSGKGPTAAELKLALESAQREVMGAAAKQELLGRLQAQYDAARAREQQENQALTREQAQIRQSFIAFFELLRQLLPESLGGSAPEPAVPEGVLFARHPQRRLERVSDPMFPRLALRLTQPGSATVGGIHLSWAPQPGGRRWNLEVGGAEYGLSRQLNVPLEGHEVRAYQVEDYLLIDVVESQQQGVGDLLRLARATAVLLEPGEHYLNLRLARGAVAMLRDGRVDPASLGPESARKYGNAPLDQLCSFARKGAESLLGRYGRLPETELRRAFDEVARLLGESAAPRRAAYLFERLREAASIGPRNATSLGSNVVDGNVVENAQQVALLAYRGEPLTVMVGGRALTLRADSEGEVTVVLPGLPPQAVGDILIYPMPDSSAVIARQGLRLAVGMHPYLH
ncbi:hypothetical protein HNR42_000564 [Deinobacterium chartae]|uniref:Uncharacterized protein n=1 Tax=Deinobacterium chartae TaxID=521158 RepID=A0A841HY60_9DEIO|nr:hypothetical protein [Deinobacterium chartae]MBB6097150.1 hypothetical protein [Deinobacterium chartae]